MKNWNKRKKDDKIKGKLVGSERFTGKINLRIVSAGDHTQVDQFCLHLKTIDKLKISSYNWSESKGLIIVISLKDAIPLGEKLRDMPLVEQVYKKKKDIAVVLDTSLPVTITPVTSNHEEVAAG